MRCTACVLLAFAASCAENTDTRPETADYIIQAILVPACGRAGCHTSETAPHDLAFDTIDDALAALRSSDRGMPLVTPGSAGDSELVQVISTPRRIMPPDSPLPQANIDLITRWVADGASGLE